MCFPSVVFIQPCNFKIGAKRDMIMNSDRIASERTASS